MKTPAIALNYNIYVSENTPGDKVNPMSDITTGLRKVVDLGNAGLRKTMIIKGLSPGKNYTWGVQSIDGAYEGSTFASSNFATTLPITLISFKGKSTPNGVQLNWTTATEQNNANFELQHSTNGKEFATISILPGSGTSTEYKHYDYIDHNPSAGTGYYRLKQVDMDGTSTYSSVIAIQFSLTPEKSALKVLYPINLSAINLSIYSIKETDAQVMVFDLNNKKLSSTIVRLNQGFNTIQMPATYLQNGMYIATIHTQTETFSQKFVR